MSTGSSRHGMRWAGALLLLAASGCAEEPEEIVRKTIGPAGGLVSSHDEVLTLTFQPGALTREHEIIIFPSDEPPLVFGPAYRVKPDIELVVDVEVTYKRALPNDTDGVAVAAIRFDDYSAQMGHWEPLPRLSIHQPSGSVLASDYELSLYYGMVDVAPTEPTGSEGTSGSTGGDETSGSTGGDETSGSTGAGVGERDDAVDRSADIVISGEAGNAAKPPLTYP